MSLEKITTQQMDAKGVCSAPDVLSGTPAQNKAIFDRMVRELVAPAYNAAVDAINEINQTESGIEAAEALRVSAEDLRAAAETARAQAESGRVTAEQARASAESLRVSAENLRADAERARAAAEQNRVTAEQSRASAEQGRVTAETERVSAEQSRVAAEQARVNETNGIVAQATAQAQAAAASAAIAEQIAIGGIPDGTIPESKLVEEVQAAIDRAKAGGAIDITLANKAPAGYGIGSGPKEVNDDLDNYIYGGLYAWDTGVSHAPFDWGIMLVLPATDFLRNTTQLAMSIYPANAIAIRRRLDGVFGPWDYFNPPMEEGVEYRTTERHLGKPVYKKRFTINALPNTAQLEKASVINVSTDILFDLHFICVDTTSGAVSSYPPFYGSTVAARAWVRATGELVISTFADLSSSKAIITLKYTKTTD